MHLIYQNKHLTRSLEIKLHQERITGYLSAYLKVLRVCSHDPELGDIQDIMTVRELPTNESLRTSVNLLPLKGIWPWSLSRARMHSFKASKLLLISAPSILQ